MVLTMPKAAARIATAAIDLQGDIDCADNREDRTAHLLVGNDTESDLVLDFVGVQLDLVEAVNPNGHIRDQVFLVVKLLCDRKTQEHRQVILAAGFLQDT